MHTNTTRATQNATLPRRNRQKPALYQHILSDLAVEADQLKTPVSPTTATKTGLIPKNSCFRSGFSLLYHGKVAVIEVWRLKVFACLTGDSIYPWSENS